MPQEKPKDCLRKSEEKFGGIKEILSNLNTISRRL